jgi:hypothetical protein
LFSDGQFALPAIAPPTYPVVDPQLADAHDAAVVNVEQRSADDLAIDVRNSGDQRALSLNGATPATIPVGRGELILPAKLESKSREVEARLSAGDLWPENDEAALAPAPPTKYERWWVGTSAPGTGWKRYGPAQLPSSAAAYLAPSVIVLDDIAADALAPDQRDRLLQYVRDLGGGLVILGGDHAFAAGGYQGTALEALSPLAGNPPTPAHRWIILVDSSGSMTQEAGDSTRWNRACSAMKAVLPSLPPVDHVFVGNFAKDLRWSIQDQPAQAARNMNMPPSGIVPHGPTNLASALEEISRASKGQAIDTALLLVTDGQARIDEPIKLIAALAASKIHVSLLAIGDEPPSPALEQIVRKTTGASIDAGNPQQWLAGLRELVRRASAMPLMADQVQVNFGGVLSEFAPATIVHWNRTWLKSRATELASASHAGAAVPLIAAWNFGSGKCAAAAYQPGADVVNALDKFVAMPPRNPRFEVSWTIGPEIRVTVRAREDGKYLNGLALQLTTANSTKEIPQTGPGQYELTVDRPRRPEIFVIQSDQRIIDRRAVAATYAPEFDQIGINRAQLAELARRTGGQMIEAEDRRRIALPETSRPIPLIAPLAIVGAALLAAGLLISRRG